MESAYDVIVVGGGAAGVVAAVQAGRAGARTLLVEKNGILGGTVVAAGVTAPAGFHAYQTQVIAGIGWELCCRARREVGKPPPEAADRKDGRTHFGVNGPVFAAVCDEMVVDARADVLLHAMVAKVTHTGDCWTAALCTKTGLTDVRCKVMIDCTGDANVVELAGLGVNRSAEPQPGTLLVKFAGYDPDSLDYEAIQDAFDKAVQDGSMRLSDAGWRRGRFASVLRGYGGNSIHVPVADGRTSEGRTAAEIEGRKAMLRIQRFCRSQAGLENFHVHSSPMECGIRETVTIRGKKTITAADYISGRLWEDAVCYSFYPVDIHSEDDLDFREIPPGVYPSIPLGALLPAGSTHLLVAGRTAAGDQAAASAYRIQASCMAMGQAAGAAGALAVELDTDV
ncbi:MAG: FAD-dependent oxidoreductase, partial [Planctomycetes bacterium]|nr:FAD-dependent oxidoreductase [Planctomycetota bacterium]